jgi:hypothetical protein
MLFKNAIFSDADDPDVVVAVGLDGGGVLDGGHEPEDEADAVIALLGPRPREFFTGVIFSISRNTVAMVGFSNPSITGDKCSDMDPTISIILAVLK